MGKVSKLCLIQARDLINMKKKHFLRNMSSSLKNYILLTTFTAINSKKHTEMH